ncbi:MAG TPA: hypothetical protein VK655_04890 [Solirubrobacteraceae bacterium]|jgi:hypothetical protein|nr:hypothetical protein [Solirubrobacteraceae bacterium]
MLTRTAAGLSLLTVVFVASSAPAAVAAGPPEAPLTKSPASSITASSAVLEGTLNPHSNTKAGWYFAYGASPECAGALTSPLEAEVEGEALLEHTEVTGLEPSRNYSFCLVATNEAGESTVGSQASFETSAAKPAVDSEAVSQVGATGATLEAQVNPENQETTYSFQYATEATGETLEGTVVTVNGASALAAEFGDRTASVQTGAVLQPGSTYFYRALAENPTPPVTDGPVQSFTTLATPSTQAATVVTGTTATLNGALSFATSNGEPFYHFEYNKGSSCTGEGSMTTASIPLATPPSETVSAEIAELAPRTQYTFCLIATNAFGSDTGAELSFTTGAGKPVIAEQSVAQLSSSGATLAASINPSGALASCRLQYGVEPAYGSEAPCPASLGEGTDPQPAQVTISGLEPHTTYHYRFTAVNEIGEGEGADETFTTSIVPPLIGGSPSSSGAGRTNVLLSGTVNPENTVLFYHFIYGPTSGYGSSTPVTEAGSGHTEEEVSQQLEGLTPNSTYHYALVISNPAGEQTSSDGTFTTTAATPPIALTGTPSALAATTATLTGSANPDSLPTTYTVQIGTDTTYGGELSGVAGSGPEAVPVSATFNNLQPGTTYHYRVLASNEDGTSYGADQTFTTAGASTPFTQPPAPLLVAIPQTPFPTTESNAAKPTPKSLTRAQKLAAALKACKKKPNNKRATCVKQARRRYGPVKKRKTA